MFNGLGNKKDNETKKVSKLRDSSDNKPLIDNQKSGITSAQAIGLRNLFYKDGDRKIFNILVLMGIIVLISASGLVYNLIKSPRVVYVAVNPDNTMVAIAPLTDPNMSDATVINWTSNALAEIFNYSHFDWDRALDKSTSLYMLPRAKENFIGTLKTSGILDAVVNNNMYSSLVVTETPIIMNKGIVNGSVFAWQFRVPVNVTYRTVRGTRSTASTIVVTVTRANNMEYPHGVAIASVSMIAESLVSSGQTGNAN